VRVVAILLLLVLAACSAGGLHVEEVGEWRGATARLRLVDVDPALGRPLRLTLELHNGGSEPLTFNAQGIRLWGLEVVGPDGLDVLYIGWRAQTFGNDQDLAPGAKAVLLEAYDISTDYLFERPGRYRIRFSGGGLSFPKRDEEWPWFFPVRLLSDWIEVTIGEGRPARVVDVVRRVLPLLPPKWSVATETFDGGLTLRLCRNSGEMGDEIWLQLGGVPESGFTRLAESLWGPLWLKDRDQIEDQLRPALLDVLTRR
jgi:hypothetical protein